MAESTAFCKRHERVSLTPASAGAGSGSEHVHEIENDDDRDRNADDPGEDTFHGASLLKMSQP